MIKKCSNCKHHAGISFDFWCGAGHTKYERALGTTDCPYFEYHDWSKGIPCRDETVKVTIKNRKKIIEKIPKVTKDDVCDMSVNEIIELFNEKEEKIQALEIENKELHAEIKKIEKKLKSLYERDLLDIERIFLDTIFRELKEEGVL